MKKVATLFAVMLGRLRALVSGKRGGVSASGAAGAAFSEATETRESATKGKEKRLLEGEAGRYDYNGKADEGEEGYIEGVKVVRRAGKKANTAVRGGIGDALEGAANKVEAGVQIDEKRQKKRGRLRRAELTPTQLQAQRAWERVYQAGRRAGLPKKERVQRANAAKAEVLAQEEGRVEECFRRGGDVI